MDITINELGQLTPDSYVLLDMRGDVEVGQIGRASCRERV